jgi:hypothetical protein
LPIERQPGCSAAEVRPRFNDAIKLRFRLTIIIVWGSRVGLILSKDLLVAKMPGAYVLKQQTSAVMSLEDGAASIQRSHRFGMNRHET